MGPWPWYRVDWNEFNAARARQRQLDERDRLQEIYEELNLKIESPILTFSGQWEATWSPDGFAMADTYCEIRALVLALLDSPR